LNNEAKKGKAHALAMDMAAKAMSKR